MMTAARRQVKLRDILTDEEIILGLRLKKQFGRDSAKHVCEKIVQPNLKRINEYLRGDYMAVDLTLHIDKVLEEIGGTV